MSTPDADARAVIAHFQRMVSADGSTVELADLEGARMRVRYAPGDCSDCVLEPEDLTGMMEEMLARRGSAITKVELA